MGPLPLILSSLAAAPGLAPGPTQDADERPTARARAIATPPTIDGRLDEPLWAEVPPIGPLTVVEPVEGAPPSQATDVRLAYDQDQLYIAIRCFDDRPEGIIQTTSERDAFLDEDDRIEILIDTFLDRRNAFFFQINPAGSLGDALVTENGGDFNKPWDGIWEGRARVDELGWTAELAIPFKTLSFDPKGDTWGFNLSRFLGRTNEDARWSRPFQHVRFFQVSEAGLLTGLQGMQQGVGLDVAPFAVGSLESDDGLSDREGDVGLNAFYRITPNLTLGMTVNTDFAETEVDQRQINLTRFPLFFPERRDFFLENAGLFEFGGLGRDLIPFFSRTIGLSPSGEAVPILVGGKLTGRVGNTNLGIVDVVTDDFEDLDGDNSLVARVSQNVGEQSTVGGIFTAGNPQGTPDNQVLGLDANLRSSSFLGDANLSANLWALTSDTEGTSGDQAAFGAAIGYPNDLWRWELEFKEIQENFDPALGFVPRRGIRKYDAEVAYRPRPGGWVRQLRYEASGQWITDTSGDLVTSSLSALPLAVEWETGDEAGFELQREHDELDADFEISDGVFVPQGSYDWNRGNLFFESAPKRPLQVNLDLGLGEFFDGNRQEYGMELSWEPGVFFRGSLEYERNDVDLPGGSFTTRLALMRADFSFTPDISWNNFLQWDNESDTVGLNTRLRWILEPGREIFLVYNQNTELDRGSTDPVFQELAVKIVLNFRF